MERLPRINAVKIAGHLKLAIKFDNGIEKEYDCEPLLDRAEFRLLKDIGFFRTAKVDVGGYGISWNEDVDLSEHELWTNGKSIANKCFT
jgi:hypothetical protein